MTNADTGDKCVLTRYCAVPLYHQQLVPAHHTTNISNKYAHPDIRAKNFVMGGATCKYACVINIHRLRFTLSPFKVHSFLISLP